MVNHLLINYQLAGELADSIFASLHAGNFSVELCEHLETTYKLLKKEQEVNFDKVRNHNEGV